MRILMFTVLLFLFPCALFSQDAAVEPALGQVLDIAKKTVAELTGFEQVDGQEQELECVGPVYSFGEPSKKIVSGTLWVWTRKGVQRPAAVFSLATIDVRRFYEYHSFCDNPLSFPVLGSTWRPAAAWKPLELPNGPTPAETEQRRLSQLKSLTARFKSSERVKPDLRVHEMRILPTPIYRYPNSTKENDGAIFVISRDGDPEALLAIELTPQGWSFMAARLSGHLPTIFLDDKPMELDYPIGPNEPYFYISRRAETAESPIQR